MDLIKQKIKKETLEEKLRTNKNLLYSMILSFISSVLFSTLIVFLTKYGLELNQHKNILLIIGSLSIASQIITIVFGSYMYYHDKSSSDELHERAQFSYLWSIYFGFLIFVPLLIYRSYYLSGGQVKTVLRAKNDYEISISFKLYSKEKKAKQAIPKKIDHKIKLTIDLFKNNYIDEEERNTQIWRLLKESTKIFEENIDYTSEEVIKKLSDIIETY